MAVVDITQGIYSDIMEITKRPEEITRFKRWCPVRIAVFPPNSLILADMVERRGHEASGHSERNS